MGLVGFVLSFTPPQNRSETIARQGGRAAGSMALMSTLMHALNSQAASRGVNPQIANQGTRPVHQRALEEAVNNGNWDEVVKILDSIPPNDPYKASMESLFRSLIPS